MPDEIKSEVGIKFTDLPAVVPDHELLRCIGQGSYGQVWLARNVMGTYRAVKVVYRATFKETRPYEREFNGIKKFEPISRSNEGLVDILQVGRNDEAGYFYYVMELADDAMVETRVGLSPFDPQTYLPKTLSTELRQWGRLSVERCLQHGLSLSLALAYLHQSGLIHRDIKPSNIIFVNGIPKLADIGLVTDLGGAMSFVGTEGYIPPEGPNSPRADIYSLGKVLYEISMGKDRQEFPEPFTALVESPECAALMELNTVIIKACAINPVDRYESADELHLDLALLQSGRSVKRKHQTERRLKVAIRVGVAAGVVALVAIAGYFLQVKQTHVVTRLAQEKAKLADEKTQLADEKSKISEENRQRIIRLDVANGVRLMDEGDFSGALLWFADALPLVTDPKEEEIHRIRIDQVLKQTPRLLHLLPHDSSVLSGSYSPDGKRIATSSKVGANLTSPGDLRIWDAETGELKVGPLRQPVRAADVRFSRDGKKIILRSCTDQAYSFRFPVNGFFSLLDAETAKVVLLNVTNVGRADLSPDERWLAVSRTNHTIELLDASNGKQVAAMTGHANDVMMLSFNAEATLLVSASSDQTVRIWRVPSGEPVGLPIPHQAPVDRAVFSKDSRYLATATTLLPNDNNTACFIHTWDAITLKEIGLPVQIEKRIWAADFDPFADRLLTATVDGGISLVDPFTHRPAFPSLKINPVRCWAFSPDKTRIAAGADTAEVGVWDLKTGATLIPKLNHDGWVLSIQFSPDGTRLLTTSDDGTAKVWDLALLDEAAKPFHGGRLFDFPPQVYPAKVSPDGHRFFLGHQDAFIHFINLDTLTEEQTKAPAPGNDVASAFAFDSQGKQWAAGLGLISRTTKDPPKTATLWRKEGSGLTNFVLNHPHPVRDLKFLPGDTQLITWSGDFSGKLGWQHGSLHIWKTKDGSLAKTIPLPEEYPSADAFSENSNYALLRSSNSMKTVLFDVQQGHLKPFFIPEEMGALAFSFSSNSTRLASVGSDQCGHIFDVLSGRPLTPSFKHGGGLGWVEWSPDENTVLTSGLSAEVKLWDSRTGNAVSVPMHLNASLHGAHFSPDGRFIVARSDEYLARVWDAATGQPVTPVLFHDNIYAALITRDQRLVTVSFPSVVRAWDLKPTTLSATTLLDYAQRLSGRRLSSDGGSQSIEPAQLIRLDRKLRQTKSALFEVDKQQLTEWHRRQVNIPNSQKGLEAASFHLAQIAKLNPEEKSLDEQRETIRYYQIPSRDPKTPSNLVDLSAYYNSSLTVNWEDTDPSHHLGELPRGIQTMGGVPFDVRGLIQVGAEKERIHFVKFPTQMSGIRVNQKAKRLHCLHASRGGHNGNGVRIGTYLIHYSNGEQKEIPIVYGEDLRDWFAYPEDAGPATNAEVAWTGNNPYSRQLGLSLRLYKRTWENPQPELEIASIDFINVSSPVGNPFLIALTAE